MMIELHCKNCGDTFTVFPSRIKGRDVRYCSMKCKGEASRGKPLKGTAAERLWARVDKNSDDCWNWTHCWNWTGPVLKSGYGHIGLIDRTTTTTHRLAYSLTRGPIPPGAFVLHSCDNRRCCNPDHLRLGNVQDNADDMVARNRQATGEKHGHAKLTQANVRAIRQSRARAADLARQYGVSDTTIRQIRSRKVWAWLD